VNYPGGQKYRPTAKRGLVFVGFEQKMELSQFHGYEKSFVLTLRACFFDGKIVQQHFQIVSMDAYSGIILAQYPSFVCF